jgi:tetratricopeptide (TPR) repeat protein
MMSTQRLLFSMLLATAGCARSVPATAPSPAAPTPEPVHAAELSAGIQAFDAGEYDSARASFQAAARSNPGDYIALWNLGQVCEKLGDGICAANAYRAELAVKPDADRASAALANLYTSDGRVDEALAIATRELATHPGSASLHAAMGNALATRGDQDPAINQLVQAIEIEPANPMLHYTLAVWLNRWHIRGAGAHLDAAAPLVHDDYAMSVSVGHEYRLAGDFAACVRTFDGVIKHKDRGEPRTERALCKLGLQDAEGALADLRKAVVVEPSYAQGHFFLAGRLAVAKHFKDAATEYQAYLQLAPDGSLADEATQRLVMAQSAAGADKGVVATKGHAR